MHVRMYACRHVCMRGETHNGIPRSESHAVVASHGKNIPLKVAEHDVPSALVDGELGLAV